MSPNGLGWIIVDSLDTLMIMNLTTRLSDARQWLVKNLTYDQDQDVNAFETTIRMLGGLLSAHYLSTQLPDASSERDHIYLSKAVDLADRLLAAYDSGSGIPYASVNLAKREGIRSHADGGASSTAEAATVQLEMKYLSVITGDDIYWHKAERVMEVLDSNGAKDGLVPIYVHPDTGRFRHKTIRLGSRGDSYYGVSAWSFRMLDFGSHSYRILGEAIPADQRINLRGDVGRGADRDSEESCHLHQVLQPPIHC